MHPAYSVIFFTTASGAGYGLLALIGLFSAAGHLPATTWLGLFGMGLAIALIAGGLLSSTLHLGRPERFLNAFSQWRSSWLSREAVFSMLTFLPAAILGVGWVFFNVNSGTIGWMGGASALFAAATVASTGMIYATLPPIRQWRNGLVVPLYLMLALATGALLLVALTRLFGSYRPLYGWLALAVLLATWLAKTAYWRMIDRQRPVSTLASATGLGHLGPVRLLEMPHTEENFLMKEMGFVVARKHARKLRDLTHLTLFLAPGLLMLLSAGAEGAAATLAALAAVAAACAGIVTERWLFFAEATHASMLYYGRAA